MKSKDICSILCWPLLLWIGQFFIVAILAMIYFIITKDSINFQNFLNHHNYLVTILELLIFIPILQKQKTIRKKTITYKQIGKIIGLGFLISIPLNILLLILKLKVYTKLDNTIYPFVALNTILIGPILEECIFRGIVFEKLKEKTSIERSKWISTILFSIIHGNIFSIINAFIEGTILVSLYEKYKTIYIPIIYHITINFVATLLIPILYQVIFI